MKEKRDETFVKFRMARTLLVSSFYSLKNSTPLMEQFYNENDFNIINHLLHKAKTRFETYKGVLETAPNTILNDMAVALVESFKEYFEAVRDIVYNQNWDLSEYQEITEEYVDIYFGGLDFEDFDTYKEVSKNSSRFYHKLASATNGANAYYASIAIVEKVLDSIHFDEELISKIVREITFPPEFTQAGVGLLNYFSVIIEKKYPNTDISVSIQQSGNNVTMVVTLPDGSKDEIVHTLNNYGLVLTGKMQPEELLDDKIQVMALKHKLEMSKMEVSHVKEMMELERNSAQIRIDSLESEVNNLRNLVGNSMHVNESMQSKLINLFASHIDAANSGDLDHSIRDLATAISERNTIKAEIVLDDMSTKEPELFERIRTLITEGVISGIVGNSAFIWLQAIIANLPK